MECIVLAGGRGTRLASVLGARPKPLADIGGRPFLEHLLDMLVGQGCSGLVLSVGYLAEQIVSHFGDSYRGCPIRYAFEESPLGTGGAIRFALRQTSEDDVFVLNGDTLLDLDLAAMTAAHIAKGAQMTIALRRVPDVSRYGAVVTDADKAIQTFGEKSAKGPGWINAGVWLIRRTIFENSDLPEIFSFEADFIAKQLKRLRPVGFETDGYFIDIGIPEDLVRAQAGLSKRSRPK